MLHEHEHGERGCAPLLLVRKASSPSLLTESERFIARGPKRSPVALSCVKYQGFAKQMKSETKSSQAKDQA